MDKSIGSFSKAINTSKYFAKERFCSKGTFPATAITGNPLFFALRAIP